MASTINAKNTSTGVVITPDASGQLELQTADTTRMTIDVNGNVGVGTSSPASKLTVGANPPTAGALAAVASSAGGVSLSISDNVRSSIYVNHPAGGLATFNTDPGGAMAFATNGTTERMRIDSSGNVLVGTTSPATTFTARLNSATTGTSWAGQFENNNATYDVILCVNHATSGNNRFIAFATEAGYTERGFIDYNRAGNAVRYNTTSDSRLKENIKESADALPIIQEIKIRAFDWKESKNHVSHGVIAQELKTIVPDAISEGDDNDEIQKVWGVDTSVLVPYVVKAIQELKAELDTVKAELATLKGTA